MEEERRVRIADIAEELGLSTATVSNVIHGKTGKVSDETVRRVQALLEQREYIPAMAGILLAQNDSKIIGVVVNDHEKYEGHVLEDGFVSASLNALSKELDRGGYFMMVRTTTCPQEIERFASMWNMAGLVLIGFCEQDYQRLRDRMRIPFVVYDGFLNDAKRIVNLVVDNFGGGRLMGEHLKALGHERVLCIADNGLYMDAQRWNGLRAVLPDAERLIVPMKQTEREAFYREHLTKLLEYTAVFAVSDFYAVDLIQFLQKEGVKVPEQLSVAGFDNSLLSAQIHPAVTTVGQNHAQRASLALELLLRLRNHEPADSAYLLPVTLLERESTRPRFAQTP